MPVKLWATLGLSTCQVMCSHVGFSKAPPVLRQNQFEQEPHSGLVGEGVQDQQFDQRSEVWDVQLERPPSALHPERAFHPSFNQATMTRSCGQLQCQSEENSGHFIARPP